MIVTTTRSAIDAALRGSDFSAASALAEAALARGERDALLFRLAAWRYEDRGDFAGAHELLAQALALAPGDRDILNAIATVWRHAGNPTEALRIFDAMIARGLDYAPTWLERGHTLGARNAYQAANESYCRAAAADPGSVAAFAGIAGTASQLGDSATAVAAAAQALSLDPANVIAQHVLARIEIDEGRFDAARARLEPIRSRAVLSAQDRTETLTLLAEALDAADQIDAAFAAYAEAQAIYRRSHEPRFGDERRSQRALIAHVLTGMTRTTPASWPVLPPDPAAGAHRHVFLLGYPRSGTTLVENVLAALPDVVALEEKPTLVATEAALLGSGDGIATLGDMTAEDVARFRSSYWRSVAMHGVEVAGKTFIDMDPLKGILLPIIARLFPASRIVVMRRDPRDVVWSCFRQNFHPTPAAYAFANLEDAARHYDGLMALTQHCLDTLPINHLVLRYDELVADFDTTTRRLCAFVGLAWQPDVREFDRVADQRGISTASARQLRRGLFDGGGQWRRYRAHLQPILPILQPWIDRFGFN